MNLQTVGGCLALLGSLTSHILAASDAQSEEWVWRNPLPQANLLHGVAAGTNGFIAVGAAGTILVSSNGLDWVLSPSPTREGLFGIAYGDGVFVAAGSGGTILRTEDHGRTWSASESKTTSFLTSITYGNHRFVAVGADSAIVSSPDGIAWANHSLGTDDFLGGAAYGMGLYVAVSWSGEILTSSDGEHWSITNPDLGHPLYVTAYGGNRFVVLGYNGTVLLSDDGQQWTGHTVTDWSGDPRGLPLIHVNDYFITSVHGRVYKSADGVEWTETAPNMVVGSEGFAYWNGVYVTVGYHGQLWSSTNLVDWTSGQTILSPHRTLIWEVHFGSDMFLALGAEYSMSLGNALFLTSTDGSHWVTNKPVPINAFGKSSIAYADGTFVGIGPARFTYVSSDGTNWSEHFTGTGYPEFFNGIGHGRNVFVVAGGDEVFGPGLILTSPDGVDWSRRVVPPNGNALLAVAYGNDTYVVVGVGGRILTSTDSVFWSEQHSGTPATLDRIVFGNGQFVATGFHVVVHSSDGSNWVASPGLPATGAITFGAGTFLAAADGGRFLTSIDGARWGERSGLGSPDVRGLTYGKGTFIAVGDDGTILQTTSAWKPALSLRWPSSQSNPELMIAGRTGQTCRVEYRATLDAPSGWQPLTNLQLHASPQSWTDASATRTNTRIYRATAQP